MIIFTKGCLLKVVYTTLSHLQKQDWEKVADEEPVEERKTPGVAPFRRDVQEGGDFYFVD